jgi:hypothetical protein
MIGQFLEARRSHPVGAILFLLIAAACVAASYATRESGWGIFGILPALLGGALLVTRPKPFRAQLTEEGLSFEPGGNTISYQEISRLWHDSTTNSIYVFHQTGNFHVPECIGISTRELLAFLKVKQAPGTMPDVHPSLGDYLRSHASTFGIDRLWIHNARPSAAGNRRTSNAILAALWLTVAAWIIAAIATKEPGWAGGAVFVVLFALVTWYVRQIRSTPHYGIKNWRDSSVVIGPAGLALVQGDLKGELRWAELRGLKLKDRGAARFRRIEMRVEGAQIQVKDIYDSTLSDIHQQIEQYWKAG